MQITDYITINALRNVIDIALVFILVYVVLKLLRGTRAVPTVVGLILLGLLYWIAIAQDLATLEFVLRYAVIYIGFAIIVLFQSEIRQALIFFANRLRFPSSCPSSQRCLSSRRRHRRNRSAPSWGRPLPESLK